MSLMARRWEVGALHQMQGMSQSAICRKTGYHHRFVKKWLKVPYTANDGEFVRSRGGVKNAQKFDEKVFFQGFILQNGRFTNWNPIGWQETREEIGVRRAWSDEIDCA